MNDDRARQGIEHLQAAGVEVISALRAFLDVAEDLIRDPAAAATLAASLAEVVRTEGRRSETSEEHDDEPRVTRIRVS